MRKPEGHVEKFTPERLTNSLHALNEQRKIFGRTGDNRIERYEGMLRSTDEKAFDKYRLKKAINKT